MIASASSSGFLALIASFGLALTACSSGAAGTDNNGGGDIANDPYPAGPYGNSVGQTLYQFSLPGYRLSPQQTDSTKLPFDPAIDLIEYHRNPTCKVLVVTVAATWCGSCMQEQPALIDWVASDPSFCVYGILQASLQGGQQEVATKADLDTWTQQYKENFAYTQGSEGSEYALIMGQNGSSTVGLPFSLIVRPRDMKIVGIVQGSRSDLHDYAMSLVQ
jgi:hypothetical protein